MQSRWIEALASINEYAKGLKSATDDFRITVATFDTAATLSFSNTVVPNIPAMTTAIGGGVGIGGYAPTVQNSSTFDIIRANVSANDWSNITNEEVQPRGSTPLFDATAKLVNLARSQNPDRAVLVIMTDGEENSSTEVRDAKTARAMLDEVRHKGWQVVFLGADFDNVSQASTLGASYANTISAKGGVGLSNATRSTANYARQYATTGADMSYSLADRAAATSSVSNEDDAKI